MRQRYARCLTIAGSDCSGGAGIQADIKTMSALGVYAMSAITAITVQNTCGVFGIQAIEPHYVKGQIDAIMSDIGTDAVKIGMLFNIEIAKAVHDALKQHKPANVILDPVMISTSGHRLIEEEAIDYIQTHLFGLCELITPNLDEAKLLSNTDITDEESLQQAGRNLLNRGCKAVLIKGGHWEGDVKTDYLFFDQAADPLRFIGESIQTENTHGTGCTLSSAIAAHLAVGYPLEEAVTRAKQYVTDAIQAGADVYVGEGHGPLNHFYAPQRMKPKVQL